MKVGIKKVVDVELATVTLFAKLRDEGTYTFHDSDGNCLLEVDSEYVPDFFPNESGDYIELIIDVETGQIRDWDSSALAKYFRAKYDERTANRT